MAETSGTLRKFDRDGKMKWVSDLFGNRTLFEYAGTNSLRSPILLVASMSSFTAGVPFREIKDFTGRTTKLTIQNNQLRKIEDPDGSLRTFGYESGSTAPE